MGRQRIGERGRSKVTVCGGVDGGVNFGGTGKLRMVSGPQYFNAAKSYARAAASSSSYAPAWIDMPGRETMMSNTPRH